MAKKSKIQALIERAEALIAEQQRFIEMLHASEAPTPKRTKARKLSAVLANEKVG